MRKYLFLSFFLFTFEPLEAKILYVDKNHPNASDNFTRSEVTENTPWLTLTPAKNTVVAGDTVIIKQGSYHVPGGASYRPALDPVNSGTPTAPITFKSALGHDVEITSDGGPAFGVNGDSHTQGYVIYEGFKARAAGCFSTMGCVIRYCEITGRVVTHGDNNDGLRIERCDDCVIQFNDIYGSRGTSWNSAGIKVYGKGHRNLLVEDNYIHDNTAGVFDKDAGIENTYRRNFITKNSKGQFVGNNQWEDATFFIYDNVIDGTINLLVRNKNSEIHDNLLRTSTALSGKGEFDNEGIYRGIQFLHVWNNVIYSNAATNKGYYAPAVNYQPPGAPTKIEYMDHNLYSAPPSYEFGTYSCCTTQIFDLDEFRGEGFELSAQVASSQNEIYDGNWNLNSSYQTMGRFSNDPVGPGDGQDGLIAKILDTTRYGPMARDGSTPPPPNPDPPSPPLPPTNAALPEMPRETVKTDLDLTYDRPADIVVAAGDNFQAALNSVQPGEIIELEAGATFTGTFKARKKTGDDWIYIRTSEYKNLPDPGNRVGPQHANLMPKINKIVNGDPTPPLDFDFGAHHYRFIGIEFKSDDNFTNQLIRMGAESCSCPSTFGRIYADEPSEIPHHVIFDRVYVHGVPDLNSRVGLELNGNHVAVVDSYISDIHHPSQDTQAILGFAGYGPVKILNNYLEAAGENVMFGGANPWITDLVPQDIEIVGNYFYKPDEWDQNRPQHYNGYDWAVKNLFEIKAGKRFLIEKNIFEHNWNDAQRGVAIQFTPRNNNGGCSWCTVEDITFRNNIVKDTRHFINFLGSDDQHPSGSTTRILIENNLVYDLYDPSESAIVDISGGSDKVYDLTIRHNTMLHANGGKRSLFIGSNKPSVDRFDFTYNIVTHGQYGIHFDQGGFEQGWAANYTLENNVVSGGHRNVPANNYVDIPFSSIGFVDPDNDDYRLALGTPYKGIAPGSRDLGADVGYILNETSCVVPGTCVAPPDDPDDPAPSPNPDPEAPQDEDAEKFVNVARSENGFKTEIPCKSNVLVYSQIGKLVASVTCSGGFAVFDASELASGIYFIIREGYDPKKLVVVK